MRLQGKKIEGANIEQIIIPRGDTQIVFLAQAVLDYTVFDELCPRPKPKISMGRGGKKTERTDTPDFMKAIETYAEQRTGWMIVTSLSATPELEWETVDMNKPATWVNYKTELEASGFSEPEFVRILNGVMAANGLDEGKVEEARQRFLASRQAESESQSSLTDEANSTPSGELANEPE